MTDNTATKRKLGPKVNWTNYFLIHSRLRFKDKLITPGVPVRLSESLYLEYTIVRCQVGRPKANRIIPDPDPIIRILNSKKRAGGIELTMNDPNANNVEFMKHGSMKLHEESCRVIVNIGKYGGSGLMSTDIKGWPDVRHSPLLSDDIRPMFTSGERFSHTNGDLLVWTRLQSDTAEDAELRLSGVRYLLDNKPVLQPNFLYRSCQDYKTDYEKGIEDNCWSVPSHEKLEVAIRKKVGKGELRLISTGYLPINPKLHSKGVWRDRVSELDVKDNLADIEKEGLLSTSGKLLDIEATKYLYPQFTWMRGDTLYDLDLLGARRSLSMTGISYASI